VSKYEFGDECPICGHALSRQYNRDHVMWHFLDDLKKMAQDTVPYDGSVYRSRLATCFKSLPDAINYM
jgi:hypothetical protein